MSAKRNEKLRRRAARKAGRAKQRRDAERRARRDASDDSYRRMLSGFFAVRPPGDHHPAAGHIPIEQVRRPDEIAEAVIAAWINKNGRHGGRR